MLNSAFYIKQGVAGAVAPFVQGAAVQPSFSISHHHLENTLTVPVDPLRLKGAQLRLAVG